MKTQPYASLRLTTTVLAVLALGLGGWLGYQGFALVALTRQVRDQGAFLQREQQLAVELREAQATAGNLQSRVHTRPASWSWSEQLPVMIGQVSGLVRQSGVRVESMQPAPVVEAQKLARFPLRLALKGDLASLVVFLSRLREASPVLGVDQLAVHTGTLATDPLGVQVTVSSYVVLQGAARGVKP